MKNEFVTTVGSPKGFIFITAGQRPAGRKASRENCLKGRTVNRISSLAFQATGQVRHPLTVGQRPTVMKIKPFGLLPLQQNHYELKIKN
jgi:hypothetical protein